MSSTHLKRQAWCHALVEMPTLKRQREADPWDLLVSWPSLVSEPQVSVRDLQARWVLPIQWHPRLIPGRHPLMHIGTHMWKCSHNIYVYILIQIQGHCKKCYEKDISWRKVIADFLICARWPCSSIGSSSFTIALLCPNLRSDFSYVIGLKKTKKNICHAFFICCLKKSCNGFIVFKMGDNMQSSCFSEMSLN